RGVADVTDVLLGDRLLDAATRAAGDRRGDGRQPVGRDVRRLARVRLELLRLPFHVPDGARLLRPGVRALGHHEASCAGCRPRSGSHDHATERYNDRVTTIRSDTAERGLRGLCTRMLTDTALAKTWTSETRSEVRRRTFNCPGFRQ